MRVVLLFLLFLIACAPGGDEVEEVTFTITSTAFTHNEDIPAEYTCEGADTSPPLTISGLPEGTQSLVLIVDDPDAPDPAAPKMVWDHWVVFNIPPDTTEVAPNTVPGTEGANSWGRGPYGGPCPPIGKHRYFFKLYALDAALELDSTATKADVEAAMEGRVLSQTELIGLYEKTQ